MFFVLDFQILTKGPSESDIEKYGTDRIFEAIGTVDMKDDQKEWMNFEKAWEETQTWFTKRDAPITDNHTHLIVGKGLEIALTKVEGNKAIYLKNMIRDTNDFDTFIWTAIQKKNKKLKRDGMSMGGLKKSFKVECDDVSCHKHFEEFVILEYAVVAKGSNPGAVILGTMTKKADKNQIQIDYKGQKSFLEMPDDKTPEQEKDKTTPPAKPEETKETGDPAAASKQKGTDPNPTADSTKQGADDDCVDCPPEETPETELKKTNGLDPEVNFRTSDMTKLNSRMANIETGIESRFTELKDDFKKMLGDFFPTVQTPEPIPESPPKTTLKKMAGATTPAPRSPATDKIPLPVSEEELKKGAGIYSLINAMKATQKNPTRPFTEMENQIKNQQTL